MARTPLVTLIVLFACAAVVRAAKAPLKVAADPDEIKLVEIFLKTPINDLPEVAIPKFLSITPESLPVKLRRRFAAKRLELYTLKQLARTNKKGIMLMTAADCAIIQDAKSGEAGVLAMAGYIEISDDDLKCIQGKTKCTERQLMCEFSLQVLDETKTEGRKRRRYFLHGNDPLTVIPPTCRPGFRGGGNNNFFSRPTPICSS